MVNQIYTDLQKIKCYNLWSKLPVKKSFFFVVNPDKQNVNFWELSQKGAFPEKNLWYRFVIAHLAFLLTLP